VDCESRCLDFSQWHEPRLLDLSLITITAGRAGAQPLNFTPMRLCVKDQRDNAHSRVSSLPYSRDI
jgi:hypothetical protein